MYIGACDINIVKFGVPKYEIYLAVDYIAGEYNDKTIGNVKCINESEYLGNEMNAFFHNPYDINNHRTIIKSADLKASGLHNKSVKKTGGRRRKKSRNGINVFLSVTGKNKKVTRRKILLTNKTKKNKYITI